jgi:hypothetical protein
LGPPNAGDRVFAWIVTGPVGRVVAFFADLAVYAWRSLRNVPPERRGR